MPIEPLLNNTSRVAIQSLSSASYIPIAAILLTIVICATLIVVAVRFRHTMIGGAFLIAIAGFVGLLIQIFKFSRRTVTEAVSGNPHLLYWVGGVVAFLVVSMFIGPKVEELFLPEEKKVKRR